jgi:succinoglycan biosynthesis protein ExoL
MKSMNDYLFISSSEPSPVMMDRINITIANGYNPLYVNWNRNQFYLLNDFLDKTEFDKKTYNIGRVTNPILRFWKLVKFIFWLKYELKNSLKKGSICYCDSFDLLFSILLINKSLKLEIRYGVEDLNKFQLRSDVIGYLFRRLENVMLKKVDSLILTSDQFWYKYYEKLGIKKYIIVENVPRELVWHDFNRKKNNNKFVIGYVGIIRYFKCMTILIEAIRVLKDEGLNVEVLFCGGGDDLDKLKVFCAEDSFVKFEGPYNYVQDIKNIYSGIDLIYCVYDTSYLNVRYAMPNKFYESIISKIPILVSRNTYLEKRTKVIGIGTSVDYNDEIEMINTLKDAILKKGWYEDAEKKLQISDELVNYYFNDNRKAMLAAIL